MNQQVALHFWVTTIAQIYKEGHFSILYLWLIIFKFWKNNNDLKKIVSPILNFKDFNIQTWLCN